MGDILKILENGSVLSIDSLSEKIGTSPGMARAMLDDLMRRGYICEAGTGAGECPKACKGCTGNCTGFSGGVRAWEITERRNDKKSS